jgi:ferric-dicitrate binding protein FerR (iron transport regulator)
VNYNNSNRRVLLEGEAYFVVRHEGHYPFTVQLGDMAVVDIGTEFNIRHYTGQGAVEVAVAKGKVAVNSTKSGKAVRIAALTQGQGLQYDPVADKAVAVDLQDIQLVGSWRKGVLAFRKRPLKDVTDEMERYYGVSIRYGNPAYGALLITTLLNNRSLEEALEIVTVTAGIHYSRNGNTVLLH